MNFGQGSIGFNSPFVPGGGTVLAANNGVSLANPATVVLGDDPGGLLSAFLNNREIEVGNFSLSLINSVLSLVSQFFGGGIIFTDNANGLQGIVQSTAVQLNSNVFGGVLTMQCADPLGNPQTFITMISPANDSIIQFGPSFRFLENLDGCTYSDNSQTSIFQFDVTNTELKIFQGAPATKAGAVIAGKAITSPVAVNPINLSFPGDIGRVISNQANPVNPPAAACVINVPLMIEGAYFDFHAPNEADGTQLLTIQLAVGDIPYLTGGIVGTSGGTFTGAPVGGAYIRILCTRAGNGVDSNVMMITLDGSGPGPYGVT